MKIVFLVQGPTQFEVPFYRFAAADPEHRLRVVFAGPALGAERFDPELGRAVSWGIDLAGGYDHQTLPRHGAGRWLRRELGTGCDLLIVNGYTRRPYLVAALAARRAGVPCGLRIDSVRFAGEARPAALRSWLIRAGLGRLFDRFFAVGSLTRAFLEGVGVRSERIALFPYAVDDRTFRRASDLPAAERTRERVRRGVSPRGPVILAVAKLAPRETPWDLLAALALLPAPRPSLLVAGDGPQRARFEAEAARLGAGAVAAVGYVPYPELARLYAASDLFVHAPREERWGVSVAEALACGLPVVASSRVGAAHDLIRPGVNGFTYRAGDAAALAGRLREALRLDRAGVRRVNDEVLDRWGYAASWQGLLAAAAALRPPPS